MSTSEDSKKDLFDTKYDDFAGDLLDVFPEMEANIRLAIALNEKERMDRFRDEVLPIAGSPMRDQTANPRALLPGVTITDATWAELSENNRKSIQEYITLLSFACLLQNGTDISSSWAAWTQNKESMDEFMGTWADKLGGIDLKGLMGKFSGLFGGKGDGFPSIPEKFLKGHIARLAEEIVRDFDPRDFGFTEEEIARLEKEPSRAFEVLMKMYGGKSDFIQNAVKKIGKRLQDKIMSGQIKPQEIANEAEELMKIFAENPAFVEMMESFRSMFGMEDPDLARQAGREGSARLAIVRDRLRKKLDARKAAQAQGTAQPQAQAQSQGKKGKGR
jgi:hypothetical protein